AVIVGVIAMALGIVFQDFNASFLVGWAFNVAASANLPALIMLLFWKRTTKQGITAGIVAGLLSSLLWLAFTVPAYTYIYKKYFFPTLDPTTAPMPFSQPGLVTIPLGFLVLVVVSLLTQPKRRKPAAPPRGLAAVGAAGG
ncbi:MAG: putative symporter, partial [Phycisphaerales bacterium]|nr:putative symporter [Phycisphaerales bacterium]